jgi:hypothetical protein
LVKNSSGNHDAKDDSNDQQAKRHQAPSQSAGLLCMAGYLLGGVDGRNLPGRVAGQRERTSRG